MHRNSNGGTIAVIMSVIVVGALIYLGLSNKDSSASSTTNPTVAGSSTSHHSGTRGPATNLDALVGSPAPDFQLTDHSGTTYSLADLKGKDVILFFNEGMMCYPACWNQIAALGSDERFKVDDVVALSVVVDPTDQWQQAIEKMPELGVATVVHDDGAVVSSAYGMLNTNSSMHYGQLPGHSYVVIDREGIVRHVYDDPNMAIHNDALADVVGTL